MAGSETLAAEIAAVFGLPKGTVLTTLKALRADKRRRLLLPAGRGSSARQMSAEDAVALIVAVMSASPGSEASRVTRLLLDMPRRYGTWPKGLRSLYPSVRRFDEPHAFGEGFAALFSREWIGPEQEERERREHEELGETSHIPYDPLRDTAELTVTVAVNPERTLGFASIRARISPVATARVYYATEPPRPDPMPGIEPEGAGLELYASSPQFAFSATLDGRAIRALASVLKDPVKAGFRSRKHRSSAQRSKRLRVQMQP